MTLRIKSAIHDYSVDRVPDLTTAVARLAGSGKRNFALVDETLLGFAEYASALSAFEPGRILAIKATERQKSFEELAPIFTWLLERKFRRDCEIVAIGGGIVQDVACFVASVLQRGARWHLIPTTLLAQCDSCIGSKSSINLGRFKNQLGNFYPPDSVLVIAPVLETLSDEAIRSGLGEAFKLHLLAGPTEFAWIRDRLREFGSAKTNLEEIVWSSLRIKQRSIEVDEFDRGIRNLLNYGHTFGHAFESATNFAIPHGIAVSLGVAAATLVSERLGLAPSGHFAEINPFLKTFYAPYQKMVGALNVDLVIEAMKSDKKNLANEITCILTRGFGQMEKQAVEPDLELRPILLEYLAVIQ